MPYAVIETGGKQYIAEPGKKLKIEKLPESKGEVSFDKILLVGDDKRIKVGKPYLAGAEVTAERLADAKSKKVTILRYHNKTRYRKKKGHRQLFTEVLIKDIKAA